MPNLLDSKHAIFLTFCTYGSRLHGDPRGSNSRKEEVGYIPPTPALERYQSSLLSSPVVTLDWSTRALMLDEIISYGYDVGVVIDGVNVRTQHIHIVGFPLKPITQQAFVYGLKKRLTDLANDIPSLANNTKLWARHYCSATLQAYSEWYFRVRYTLFRQGNNSYFRSTNFARRKELIFDQNGEPTNTSLSNAFIPGRVIALRKRAFGSAIESDRRTDVVEFEDEE